MFVVGLGINGVVSLAISGTILTEADIIIGYFGLSL